MLSDVIKAHMLRALREKDAVARDVLGLALGEIQTAEARANRALRDDEAAAVVRRLVKANEETLGLAGADARAATLQREIEVLAAVLPAPLSAEAVALALAPVAGAICGAGSDAQAMGVAMKHLKATGTVVEAPAVQRVVQSMRR